MNDYERIELAARRAAAKTNDNAVRFALYQFADELVHLKHEARNQNAQDEEEIPF